MIKFRLKQILPSLLATATFAVLHCTSSEAAGMITPLTISKVYFKESQTEIHLATPHANPDSCSADTVISIISNQYPNSDLIASAALTAFISQKQIGTRVHTCTSEGRAIVRALEVLD